MNPDDKKPQEPTTEPAPAEQSPETVSPAPSETPEVSTEAPTPSAAPATPEVAAADESQPPASAGQIVLQWLTYAFWGWTLLALSVLTSLVIQNIINQFDTSGVIPYVLAAVLVLLPLSFVCDLFYRKQEPRKKHGAAMVVMVIHAVIFALFGIGALIFCVFSVVQGFLATSSSSSLTMASVLSSLIIALLYGITFLRTLNPLNSSLISKSYGFAMLGIAGVFVVLSFVGPIAQSAATKDDRRIEAQLSTVKYGVDNYIRSKSEMPSKLTDLTLEDDAKAIVDDNLVTFKPVSKVAVDGTSTEYRYELCVTYKKESQYYTSNPSYDTEEYDSYLSASNHPAGNVCYKLSYERYSYAR